MRAGDLQDYLRSLDGGWMNLSATVDTFKAGDPNTEIRGIAVGWMSYTWAMQEALDLGCNVFITHEPTYYDHYDRDPWVFDLPGVRAKQRFIESNRLVVIRCHDLWDLMPAVGVLDSWAAWLGLGPAIGGEGYHRVYDVSGKTARQLAQHIALRTAAFGQQAVAFVGAGAKPVTRLGLGTGASTPFLNWIQKYRIDVALTTDDGTAYWRDAGYGIDMDVPLIVVNHLVSEEAGVMNLARHLQEHYPDIPVHHIAQRCMYTLVSNE
jgi:putative NIF3 family GTP cyclohydrolase 1 type 2